MKTTIENDTIRSKILDKRNIYLAIHMVHSYILNPELLSENDQRQLQQLRDCFDTKLISTLILDTIKRVESILDNPDDYFLAEVYFKPKKYQNGSIVFRPLHTACLLDQIAMTAMLQALVYDINQNKLVLSELSRLLPECFYGNKICTDGKHLFEPWQEQYHIYSKKAHDALLKYAKTHEYEYEINLDLEDFFPSVNPLILYNLIKEHFPVYLNPLGENTLNTVIRKLLILKLDTLDSEEWSWYLGNTSQYSAIQYVKGIPQGLPHSYFFANIIMVKIKNIYQSIFPGEMLFYVDDSVIYTNGKEGLIDALVFQRSIFEINEAIEHEFEAYLNLTNELFPQDWCYTLKQFTIRVHSPNEKSVFFPISDAASHSGELDLRGLCRETSRISFDLMSAFDEENVDALYSRACAISKNIDKEILAQQNRDSAYIERLQRYKRYFDYRKAVLKYKKDGDIDKLLKKTIRDIDEACNGKEQSLADFMKKYAEETLPSIMSYVYRMCLRERIDIKGLQEAIEKLELIIYQRHIQHGYMGRSFSHSNLIEYVSPYTELDRLSRLECWADSQKNAPNKKKLLQSLLFEEDKNNVHKAVYEKLKLTKIYEWSEIVRNNDISMNKMIFNSVFSTILQYDIDNTFTFAKRGRTPITYSEIRLLSWLRSKTGSLDDLRDVFDSIYNKEYDQTADYSIMQVMDIFHVFVKQPGLIDQLIKIHKYCCDTWKNGSKYLYFYTLHNQEHAVTLIHNAVNLVHAISQIQLNQYDYYILFAACYLHDISMVSIPNYSSFYCDTSGKADKIYSEYKEAISSNNTIIGKRALCEAYKEIDSFFESNIRNNHHKDSAHDIRRFDELMFINDAAREIIARVSKAHCDNLEDVYLKNEDSASDLVHQKIVSILLRLSDLFDISCGRVSSVLLNHNLKDMNPISRFHWISHMVTSDYSLQTVYTTKGKKRGSSRIGKHTISEEIIFNINVFLPQMTYVENTQKCKNVENCFYSVPDGSKGVTISISSNEECTNTKCCFLCKWFFKKNNYMLAELAALKEYLSSLSTNYYDSVIKIVIRVVDSTFTIPDDIFDYLRAEVEK